MILGVFFGGTWCAVVSSVKCAVELIGEDWDLRVLEVVNGRAVGIGSGCVLLRVHDGRVERGRMGMHGVLETEERKGRRIRAIAAIVDCIGELKR